MNIIVCLWGKQYFISFHNAIYSSRTIPFMVRISQSRLLVPVILLWVIGFGGVSTGRISAGHEVSQNSDNCRWKVQNINNDIILKAKIKYSFWNSLPHEVPIASSLVVFWWDLPPAFCREDWHLYLRFLCFIWSAFLHCIPIHFVWNCCDMVILNTACCPKKCISIRRAGLKFLYISK